MNPAVLLALLMLEPQAATYTISGTVVDSVSGDPLRGVRVSVLEARSFRPAGEWTTDGSGDFRFERLAAGKYVLMAEKPGYVVQRFGQKALYSAFSSAVVAGEGNVTEGLRFALIPSAAITGTVTDENGEPATGVLVSAFRQVGNPRNPRWIRSGFDSTNDLGQYRIHSLRRGSFIVLAQGADHELQGRYGDHLRRWGFPPTFAPGVPDVSRAALIRLEPGVEHRADISVRGTRLVAVVGGYSSGTWPVSGRAFLLASLAGFGFFQVGMTSVVSRQGFMIRDVPRGSYTLLVASPTQPRLIAMKQVHVEDDPVTVDMGAGVPVGAKITVEWADARPPRPVDVVLDSDGDIGTQIARLGPDASAELAVLPPGHYVPKLLSGNQVFAVTGIRVEPGRVVSGAIEIPGTSRAEIRLTAVSRVQEVTGRVFKGGSPQMGVTVILLPRDQPVRAASFAVDQTDSDGSFTLRSVAPGEYLAFAFEQGEVFDYADPEVMQPLLRLGQPVTVKAGKNPEVRLEVTRLE
ncbi:MAG: carboxypeptidase regulatory-like domain-containing protein [Acidobacteriota bacterium]